MYTFRKLELKDKEQLDILISSIQENLNVEEYWLPISDISRMNFFNDKWTYFIGAFNDTTLIAAVGLFLNKNEYGDSQALLNLENYKVAEIGRAMVLPEYRGHGLMIKITHMLVDVAKTLNINYLIATAHPQNYPSVKSLESVGMNKAKSCIKHGNYHRDIFLMDCTK